MNPPLPTPLSALDIPFSIEPLESRIAPAAFSVVYTDVDGDLVKITASKAGTIAPPLDATDLAFVGGGGSGQLATLNLADTGFDGASIVFGVTKKPGGDGLAHVGYIRAPGVDLNVVSIKGDLGKIVAGDAITAGDPGLNLLSVRTMGTLGVLTQIGVANLNSNITGRLGALKVAGDITDSNFVVTAPGLADGQIGSVFIGGDLTGGVDPDSGRIFSSGSMGSVRIGGGISGGSGLGSGMIFSSDPIGAVRIGGGISGGAGDDSGQIFGGSALGNLRIVGGLAGGAGADSGRIFSSGAIGDVQIGRDFIGGRVRSSAAMGDVRIGGDLAGALVLSSGAMGHVRIGGDLIGGSITGSDSLSDSGEIRSLGRIASVTIVGSLIAGTDASTGTLENCGAIVAGDELGPVKIGRSIVGNSANPALIIAKGHQVKPAAGFDTAIASLSVGGDVRHAKILAGFSFNQSPANADASIGAVSVGHDWVASSLVAGAQDAGAAGFGLGDTLQVVGDTALIARIASITIKGDATGSLTAGDHFGFVAQQIDKFKIGARAFTLIAGASNDSAAIPFTSDVRLLEVS